MDAALSPLRQRGVRVLNYLDDWLILAQSKNKLNEFHAHARAHFLYSTASSVFQGACIQPLEISEGFGSHGHSIISTPYGITAHAPPTTLAETPCTSPMRSGRLHIKMNHGCIRALAPWAVPDWYLSSVAMDVASRRKVVFTDASNLGWGALHEGKPASGRARRKAYISTASK